jgi:hypothetical protein
MRAFGLYLAEIVLGGARDQSSEQRGELPDEIAPLDGPTLERWRAWAARGATHRLDAPGPSTGDPTFRSRETWSRRSHPAPS